MSWDREEQNASAYVLNSALVLLWKSQNGYRCHSNFPPVWGPLLSMGHVSLVVDGNLA